MTVDKQKLRALASKATPRITLALGHSPPTPAEEFYAAALTAVPALLDDVERLESDRNRLHATLKAVVDVCIDKGGLRVTECVAEDAPPKAVAKLVEQRDEARRNYQFMVDRAAVEKLDGYRELGERAAKAENERDAIHAQLQAVQADMGQIAGVLGTDNDDVDTLVTAISSRLSTLALVQGNALRSIARAIACEPDDHEDLVEAVRLFKEEQDGQVRKLKEVERQYAEQYKEWQKEVARAELAERERDEIEARWDGDPVKAAFRARDEAITEGRHAVWRAKRAERDTAEAIAAWLEREAAALHDAAQRDALPDRAAEWPWASYETAARDIRNGKWRKS